MTLKAKPAGTKRKKLRKAATTHRAGSDISRDSVKLGRVRPIVRGPGLRLSNYLMKALPAPPTTCDYREDAAAALVRPYCNRAVNGTKALNDCVVAAIAHVVGVLTGNAGAAPFIFTDDQIIEYYTHVGGYVPGDPSSDNGCDEYTGINYWQNNGAPTGSSHTISGWIRVDATDPSQYRTALWLFENLFLAMNIPDAWITPRPSDSGFVWDVAGPSNPKNGHCVAGVGYTGQGVIISSWGYTGLITDAAIAQYATFAGGGDLMCVLSQDGLNRITRKAPSGFDWTQLVADFDAIGGNVPRAALAGV
jgi:hypothetical protein